MAGVQCPYTASNCPLFNPIFSETEVLAARSPRPLPSGSSDSPNGQTEAPRQSFRSPSPSDSNILPPISLSSALPHTSVSYTDYSLAPSATSATSSSYFGSTSPILPPIPERPSIASRTVSSSSSLNCEPNGCGPRVPPVSTSTTTPTESACAAAHKALRQQQQQCAEKNERERSVERDMEDLLGVYSFGGFMSQGNGGVSGVMSPPESFSGGSVGDEGEKDDDDKDGDYKPSGTERKHARSDSGESHSGGGGGHGGANAQEVTPFISKLSHLLSHADYAGFIRWNLEGNAFIFAHTSPALLDIFGRFFRHANVHSFVRQLNIYGFTRLSTLELLSAIDTPHPQYQQNAGLSASDFSGFSHPMFFRDGYGGRRCELEKIKPKIAKKEPAARKGGNKRKAGVASGSENVPSSGERQRRRTGN